MLNRILLVAACASLSALIAAPTRAACVGDCGDDGAVTIDELVRGVTVALGTAPVDVCRIGDTNGDGRITIDELVQAVGGALRGCATPAPPTASPSPSETATASATPSPTPTVSDSSTPAATDTATASPTQTETPPLSFTDVTDAANVRYEHDYVDAIRDNFEVPEIMGGVGAGDYDGDGWVDLLAVTGDHPNLLLRNAGGVFEAVAAPALAMEGLRSSGPTFADIDGDGALDLFIGVVEGGAPHVFRNLGDGSFEDRTAGSGLAGQTAPESIGGAFGDYDRDGDLDLLITHWGTRLPTGGDIAYLWRNDGDFRFTDVTIAAGLPHGYPAGFFDATFTANFADLDSDGWLDLPVAVDFFGSAILRNRRDATFAFDKPPVLTDENGMGAAVGDYDNDGDLDWFVTSIFDHDGAAEGNWGVTGNRLYRNRGDGTFEDATEAAGVRDGYWGWAACFADLDNDGWLDLYHVNGWGRLDLGAEAIFTPGTEEFQDDPARLFLSNRDGTFREIAAAAGVADRDQGRGVVCFDYDRDGDIDLFIANNGGPSVLFRNDTGNRRHWLAVRLRGRAPNSEGIGARVRISAGGLTQFRELRAGSNFLSQDPAIAHFGLADAGVVERLEVSWPGLEQTTVLTDVAADQYLTVMQP